MTRLILTAALAVLTAAPAMAEGKNHKLAIHIDQNDPAVMNLVLNNAQNVASYYDAQGDSVDIVLVAYGPGLAMYTEDSPVKERISQLGLEIEGIHFAACGNTLAAMEKKAGHKVALLSEAEVVPSGVVTLMTLQEDGYTYVRP